jgi:membrane-associated protease RseP (regulator of RpoE activity)
VAEVAACTPSSASADAAPLPSGECPTGTQPSPAVAAGFEVGDTILAINGVAATDWRLTTSWIRAHPGADVVFSVERGGQQLDLPTAIATAERPVLDADGTPTEEVVTAGYVGLAPDFAWVAQPWSAVPAYMWHITVRSVQALVTLPVKLYNLVTDTLIGGGERSPDSPVSVVGVSRLGGDVAAMDEPLVAKAAIFLGLAASLNLFLFLFNLLPILPLDGGHVASAAYEGIRRKIAQIRGRPDPGPVDTARLLPVAYVVAGVLLAMGLVVIWADLVKPIALG